MNIFRFVYFTFIFVYIVSSIAGAPIPQHGPRKSNGNHHFHSLHGERPVSMGSPSHSDQPQSVHGHVKTEQTGISDAQLLEELEKKLKTVHAQHPPQPRPIIVNIGVKILNTPRISQDDMTFNLNIEVRQSWIDPRFRLNLTRPVQLPGDYYDLIWNPKTVVINAFSIQVLSKFIPESRFLVDTSTGKIMHTLHLSTKTNCILDLTEYPYDWQQCVIKFGSEAYSAGSVKYQWQPSSGTDGRKAIEFSPEALARSSEFRYEGFCAANDSMESGYDTKEFSGLQLKLYVSRSALFPFYSFILPFSLLAFLGFLPPFLGPEALIGRITFGATTFIGSLGLLYRRPIGPTVVLPYLPALDVYAGLNMLLTFASLVESCIVGCIISKYQGNGDKGKKETSGRQGQVRLGNEVDTVVHFSPPLLVGLPGQGRIEVSALSIHERNYVQGSEEVYGNEERGALMQTARRIDFVTKILYVVAACGSILVIHFCYRTTKENPVDLEGVQTL